MVNLTIHGKDITAEPDRTILDVAREHSIPIPTLCYHHQLSLIKSCQICLVDVEGTDMPMASCVTGVYLRGERFEVERT